MNISDLQPSMIPDTIEISFSTGGIDWNDTILIEPVLLLDNLQLSTLAAMNSVSENLSKEMRAELFPNPFSTFATIQIINAELRIQNVEFRIYDLLGREVHQQTLNSEFETLNINLQSGIYFYKINSNKETIATGKLIAQ